MIHAAAASSDAAGIQPDEGDSQSTLPLHLPDVDLSETRYSIRLVGRQTAEAWFGRWHYLGDAPPVSDYWGLFAPDLAAVVSIGLPNNVHGVAGRLGLTEIPGNVEVNRVAVHPDCHDHTSRLVWLAVKAAQRAGGWAWCYSYADTGRGHHGGIYQALGAVYVGLTDARAGWINDDGDSIHPRTAVSLYGSQSIATMEAYGFVKVPGMIPPRHTYVIPVGPRAAEVRAALEPIALPYPKRVRPGVVWYQPTFGLVP